MSVDKTHTAVLVLNFNMPEMTRRLIDTIRKTCKPKHTIFGLDAASERGKCISPTAFQDPFGNASPADVHIWFRENKRWAWSFAHGMKEAVSAEKYPAIDSEWCGDIVEYGKLPHAPEPFTHFWLLCNDTELDPNSDTLGLLLQYMPDDACLIHPHQTTHPKESSQGLSWNRLRTGRRARAESFVEFVCPLITRDFYQRCVDRFGSPPVGPHFPYGWGVDYEMAYFGHLMGLKSYISEVVAITHHPGTTHRNSATTGAEPDGPMRVAARNSMLDVLESRYGKDWGTLFADTARKAGVHPRAFLEWSQHDRALALSGTRV